MQKAQYLRLWCLAIIVCVAAWAAYSGFEQLFGWELKNSGSAYRLLLGPISFFFASALGLIFALLNLLMREPRNVRFWTATLWFPVAWLIAGASCSLFIDWFGHQSHASPQQHMLAVVIAGLMIVAALLLWSIQSVLRVERYASVPKAEKTFKDLSHLLLRTLAHLSVATGAILTVCASALVLLLVSCEPPSIETLSKAFPEQRKDLETLVKMSDEDSQLSVIDPTWLALVSDKHFSRAEPESGLTDQRWNKYKSLFRSNSLSQGIRRSQANGDVFLIVKSEGLLDRGHSNGFLFCGSGPEHSYPPCSLSQAKGSHLQTKDEGAYSFIKLADRWYAFSQGPG